MKTKNIFLLCLLAIVMIGGMACTKGDDDFENGFGGLNATWTISAWGNVSSNVLSFLVKSDNTNGIITEIGATTFNFAVGDELFTDIKATGTGTYTAMSKYTYGTGSVNVGSRPAVLTLGSSNSQLTVVYPALDASFPEITYVFQKK